MPDQEIINVDFDRRISALENGTNTADVRHTHWYRSFGVWLSLILTVLMLYCIYLVYMKSTGHTINILGLIRF